MQTVNTFRIFSSPNNKNNAWLPVREQSTNARQMTIFNFKTSAISAENIQESLEKERGGVPQIVVASLDI